MKVLRSLFICTALLSASLVLSPLTALAQTRAVRARVTQTVDLNSLITLRGNVHPLARPEFDQGVAPDDLPMQRMLLVLQRGPEQEVALRQMLDEQQVKSSPLFHQWLTPEQFGQQFGPVDSDLQAVTDWLMEQGFQVAKVSAGRTVIEFSGTAGLVRQVLGTEIHKFRVNGEDRWANTSDPQVPAALAPVVAGFASLNNFPRKPLNHSLGTFSRTKATGQVQPLFTFPVPCSMVRGTCYLAVGPTDFAIIYNVAPLWSAGTDGTGVTIAVVGETNINIQDVRDFRSMFGLPAKDPNIILNGPDPGIISDEVEADLDVQWSGAVAKGATIDLVVSESTETTAGTDLSALYIIDNNLAPIMSESYGACEAQVGAGGNQFYNTLWEQAAAQGITVLMASGDSGPAGCDSANAGETYARYGLGVSGLASTPFNVAVGGTDFNDASSILTYWNQTNSSPSQSSAKSYIPESTWNDSCAASGSLTGCSGASSTNNFSAGFDLVAGGGGPSNCTTPSGAFPSFTCSGGYAKPSWQSGTGVPSDGARDIPDLSLFAGNGLNDSFYVICQMDANASGGGSSTSCDLNSPYTDFQAGSGTSASVQAFAGIMALVNQLYGRQGNANYVLYPMAAQSGASCNSSTAAVTNSSCIFYDVTAGNNSVICGGGTLNCSNTNSASGQYGIMVSGGSAAYPATTGYDLATGLGSINVANLVNHWTSVSFMPTTTTLSPNPSNTPVPVSLTHGQPFNFTVSVAPTSGSGTPTGDVSLIAQTSNSQNVSPTTGIGPFTLSGGSASNSTIMLPGGTYNVTAHYAGNGTFAASDSTPGIQVMVGKESSQTKFSLVTFDSNTGATTINNGSTPYGSPYVLRMDVMHSSDTNPCASATTGLIAYPCPTGALTVSPAPTDVNPPPGTVAGQYALNSQGYAEDLLIQLSPGTYPFVASYAGDNSYTGSTSGTLQVTIAPAVTQTALGSLPTSFVGTFDTLTAFFSTGFTNGVAPTGNIRFFSNGSQVGSAPVSGVSFNPTTYVYTAQTTVTSLLPTGLNTIRAAYSGDTNYGPSTSLASNVTVTDFSLSANPSTITISAGQTATTTITVTPVAGFTGTVNLTTSCSTCTVSPSQVTLAGSAPATAMFSFVTTARIRRIPDTPQPRVPPVFRLPVAWRWLLAVMLALAALLGWTATRKRTPGWLFATALVVVGVWVACGGGAGGGGVIPLPPTAPALSLLPTSLAFGQATVGTPSPVQTVALTNTGTAALNISSVAIGGTNPTDFYQSGSCGGSLAPGANCSTNVRFRPTAAGSRSASLIITDNASDSPQTVPLGGTGVQPPTAPGNYSIPVQATSGTDIRIVEIDVIVQ